MIPTDSELAILQQLWTYGPTTVRSVNEALNEQSERPIGYTTTLKLMQLMTEKGLVTRNEDRRSHVYSAAVAQQKTQKSLLGRFVESTFGGSRSDLVLRALGDGQATPAELAEIKRLIAQLEKEQEND